MMIVIYTSALEAMGQGHLFSFLIIMIECNVDITIKTSLLILSILYRMIT